MARYRCMRMSTNVRKCKYEKFTLRRSLKPTRQHKGKTSLPRSFFFFGAPKNCLSTDLGWAPLTARLVLRPPSGREPRWERSDNLFPRCALICGMHETSNADWWQLTPLYLWGSLPPRIRLVSWNNAAFGACWLTAYCTVWAVVDSNTRRDGIEEERCGAGNTLSQRWGCSKHKRRNTQHTVHIHIE